MSAAYAGELRALTAAVEQSSSELELSVLLGCRQESATKKASQNYARWRAGITTSHRQKLQRQAVLEAEWPRAMQIASAVAAYKHWTLERLQGHRRDQELVLVRFLAMYFVMKLTKLSYTQAGVLMNRDHSTVMHGCQVIAARVAKSPEFAKTIAEIEKAVSAL